MLCENNFKQFNFCFFGNEEATIKVLSKSYLTGDGVAAKLHEIDNELDGMIVEELTATDELTESKNDCFRIDHLSPLSQ